MPWRKVRAEAEAAATAPVPPLSRGSGVQEDLIVIPPKADAPPKQEADIQPVTSCLPRQHNSLESGAEVLASGLMTQDQIVHAKFEDRPDAPIDPATPDKAFSDENSASRAPSSHEDKAEATAGATDTGSEESKPHRERRTLSRKHFDVALGEIRPSSSEEGSLPELRKVRMHLLITQSLRLNFHSGQNNLARGARSGDGRRVSVKALASTSWVQKELGIAAMAKSHRMNDVLMPMLYKFHHRRRYAYAGYNLLLRSSTLICSSSNLF